VLSGTACHKNAPDRSGSKGAHGGACKPRDQVQEYIFTQYICAMDPAKMSPHGFNCFQAFFADVNNRSGAWSASGRDGQKSGCKINGQHCPRLAVAPGWEPAGPAAGTCQQTVLESWPFFSISTHRVFLDRGVVCRAAGARALEGREDARRDHLRILAPCNCRRPPAPHGTTRRLEVACDAPSDLTVP